jgi:hypothetical protein
MTRLLLLLPILALAGCSLLDQDACDAEDAAFRLVVVDGEGAPVSDATLTATNKRTGRVYGPCPNGEDGWSVGCEDRGGDGQYVVYTDGQNRETSRRGDDVTVVVERDARRAEAPFHFRSTECGIVQVAGPDTLALR